MSKADYKIEGTVPRELLVSEVRKAARQFAMQFFHFSKVLYDQFGLEKTIVLTQKYGELILISIPGSERSHRFTVM